MTQIHFIAGLPRSGSTLLSAILRQNPAITASMSSPVGGIFSAIQKAVSRGNEAAMFLSDAQRELLLRSAFEAVYGRDEPVRYEDKFDEYGQMLDGCTRTGGDRGIIFDTNRMWPSKLPVLTKLFPDCRIICCVRPVPWIMDSIERLVRRNCWELSGIFGFEPGGTVYSRCAALAASNGLVGFAMDALREGFYGEHANRMLLVEYEAMAKAPADAIAAIYRWLGLQSYAHDFTNIDQIPGAAEFDERLGTPGLHSVRSHVEWQERQSVIPPELFNAYSAPFWRVPNPRATVISAKLPEKPKLEAVSNG